MMRTIKTYSKGAPSYNALTGTNISGWQRIAMMSESPTIRGQALALFVSQRDDRIDPRRPSRRNVAGCERHEGQQARNPQKCKRVRRADTKKQAGHQSSKCQCTHKSKGNADQGHIRAVPQDHSQDVCALRAKGDSNSNLARSLADEIGNHAIDS